jgi:hypothetical protein
VTDHERRISEERQARYGPWQANMEGTSAQLHGLTVQYQANHPNAPLPEWWAPLSQVAVKLNRIASGHYHEDNFTDLRNYLQMVESMQKEGV